MSIISPLGREVLGICRVCGTIDECHHIDRSLQGLVCDDCLGHAISAGDLLAFWICIVRFRDLDELVRWHGLHNPPKGVHWNSR